MMVGTIHHIYHCSLSHLYCTIYVTSLHLGPIDGIGTLSLHHLHLLIGDRSRFGLLGLLLLPVVDPLVSPVDSG